MAPRLTGVLRQWMRNDSGYPSNWMPDIIRMLPKQVVNLVPAGAGVAEMKEEYGRSLQILLSVCGLVLLRSGRLHAPGGHFGIPYREPAGSQVRPAGGAARGRHGADPSAPGAVQSRGARSRGGLPGAHSPPAGIFHSSRVRERRRVRRAADARDLLRPQSRLLRICPRLNRYLVPAAFNPNQQLRALSLFRRFSPTGIFPALFASLFGSLRSLAALQLKILAQHSVFCIAQVKRPKADRRRSSLLGLKSSPDGTYKTYKTIPRRQHRF